MAERIPTTTRLEPVLARAGRTWTDEDPLVLAFPGDGLPIVAVVRGELRYLDYHRIEAIPIESAVIRRLANRRGDIHLLRLSEHPAGYRKQLFQPVRAERKKNPSVAGSPGGAAIIDNR